MEKLKESPRQLSLPRALSIKLSVRRCKAVLLNHAGDLGGEVVLFLLDALAGLEAGECLDGDLAAQLLGHLSHVLLHGDLILDVYKRQGYG